MSNEQNSNRKLAIGYLTYVNHKNYAYRLEDFKFSLDSFLKIQNKNCEFLSVDNLSLDEVKGSFPANWLKFHYSKNFFDIALFYTTVWYANKNKIPYVLFSYDDFIVENQEGLNDVITFMDENPDVHCTRVTAYDFENSFKYDSSKTPKQINPDAIRHFNDVTNEVLRWSEKISIGNSNFYKNNWHYTSRPCVWRTDVFLNALENSGLENIPILQGFEGWAKTYFNKIGLVTGVMDGGIMRTTDVRRSARTNELQLDREMNIRISREELRQAFKECYEQIS